MKKFGGKTLFLDRSDINTDEIIPAKYLTENSKKALKPYLLEDLKLNGFDPQNDLKDIKVIITKDNFGCGSSREHAPWALEINDINVVIASGFARIFRQNMYNCGMLAIELSKSDINSLFDNYANTSAEVSIDTDKSVLTIQNSTDKKEIPFKLEGFDRELVKAGGWVEYADAHY